MNIYVYAYTEWFRAKEIRGHNNKILSIIKSEHQTGKKKWKVKLIPTGLLTSGSSTPIFNRFVCVGTAPEVPGLTAPPGRIWNKVRPCWIKEWHFFKTENFFLKSYFKKQKFCVEFFYVKVQRISFSN